MLSELKGKSWRRLGIIGEGPGVGIHRDSFSGFRIHWAERIPRPIRERGTPTSRMFECLFSSFVPNQMFWSEDPSCCCRVGMFQGMLFCVQTSYRLNQRNLRVAAGTGSPGGSRAERLLCRVFFGDSHLAGQLYVSPESVGLSLENRWDPFLLVEEQV